MRTESDLRSALRLLEREAPAAQAVLRRVTGQASAGVTQRQPGRRRGRRLVAGAAAAAAVIAVAAVSLLTATLSGSHVPASAPRALHSVPRYYLALIPAGHGTGSPQYGVIRDTLTGRTLATIRPPRPFVTFTRVSGAADDRTFVLTAQAGIYGNQNVPARFYLARFSPADGRLTLSAAPVPEIPSIDLAAQALSPDGTRLAIAVQGDPNTQLRVYSMASGAVRVWRDSNQTLAFDDDVVGALSWSRTGLLVFGWHGSFRLIRRHHHARLAQTSAPGSYLLSTAAAGGPLLADSRFLCLPVQGGFAYGYGAYLTPDGTKVIVPVNEPVRPGQRPATCSVEQSRAPSQVLPKLELFSVATGRAIRVIYRSASHSWKPTYDVLWSSPSGSVLVVDGPAGTGSRSPAAFGVVSGGRFTPIPGAPDPFTGTLAF